jgi:hypothetical protein
MPLLYFSVVYLKEWNHSMKIPTITLLGKTVKTVMTLTWYMLVYDYLVCLHMSL